MYEKKTHIHFVGIGGIGMSGIAKILACQGYYISGCDLDCDQQSVHDLKSVGCSIYQGNNSDACHDSSIDILVYSSAIQKNDPEILRAQERGIPTISRATMLAELMRTKFSVAITGAHGKTTTTSLISHILIEAACDPTVIVGGHLKTISTNARLGSGDFLVAEADESDKSLLRLYPTLAVVTNIDFEHVDTYKDLDDIKQTFKQFLSNLPFYGKAIICYDDVHIKTLLPELTHIKTIKYGLTTECDFYATEIVLAERSSTFVAWHQHECLGHVTVAMPGIHNVYNSLAAIATTYELSVDFAAIAQALSTFKGVERRFSYKGLFNKAEVFDDYGHHPTEIKYTLAVARKRAHNKLVVAFQPQRYTRTHGLWQDFINVLAAAPVDHLIITDIYAASEKPIENVSSERLVRELKAVAPHLRISYVPYDVQFAQLRSECEQLVTDGDLLLTLGAGKMNKLADMLVAL